ncbi:uncharacterized protein LOC111006470 isoform X2 [Momordica charantia]|uniref:Uncharacterized protein LOC111006470 isoform X2 n=1 Tax=Momordica charantia TaxID=3673 RepID=A0A6J1C145_MOMCH|nr:uncharacterized protein LOC111006470 isoform X2 [Momordica charantia]
MASPSPSPSSSSFSSSEFYTVTQEEFITFHTIDRTLFSRMVYTLGRDSDESVRVMGLWLWLEQNGEEFNLVHKMLSLPDALVDALSDEAVMSLACIENDKFPFEPESSPSVDIPLIQHVSKTPVSLRFFHENRLRILRGVSKIINDICLRAFHDILQNLETQRVLPRAPLYFGAAPAAGQFVVPSFGFVGPSAAIRSVGGEHRRVILNGEVSDVFRRLQLKSGKEGEKEEESVPAEERTIFLTFSKGYPISEDEVRDYFARYGNFIESIHMQEVQPPEQPLYARLVVKTEPSIDIVLESRTKAKFSINGKHVWARKYVRKNSNSRSSPLRPSPPPSPPLDGIRPFNFPPQTPPAP